MSAAAIATLGDSFHAVCALNGFFVRDVAEALTYAAPPPILCKSVIPRDRLLPSVGLLRGGASNGWCPCRGPAMTDRFHEPLQDVDLRNLGRVISHWGYGRLWQAC